MVVCVGFLPSGISSGWQFQRSTSSVRQLRVSGVANSELDRSNWSKPRIHVALEAVVLFLGEPVVLFQSILLMLAKIAFGRRLSLDFRFKQGSESISECPLLLARHGGPFG